jgi:AcrR family transcriptional regulator
VLTKAIPVFWKRGFADTKIEDLKEATGVNKSGLYSEFGSKEIFVESLKHYLTFEDILSLSCMCQGKPFRFMEGFLDSKDK